MKYKVGIIGHGFVGLSVETGLQTIADVRIYDKFKDSESLYDVVNNSDTLFICLPTPINADDGSCCTGIIESVCQEIKEVSKSGKRLIIKSTVPPGTTQLIADQMGKKFKVFFSPEFLTEKNAIQDFLGQDRIIFGKTTQCKRADASKVLDLLFSFTETQEVPAAILETSTAKVAEMIKYTANTFLATKVTFFNEIFEICEEADIDYIEMVNGLLYDKRIGKSHYRVPGDHGRGWGGSCFPKDLSALIAFAKLNGVDPVLLESVWVKNLILREFKEDWMDLSQVSGDYKKNG